MKKIKRLNELIQNSNGQIVGVSIFNRDIKYYYGKPYKFSAKITKETKDYVTFKPLSGLFRGETRVHKKSINQLVVSGKEYNSN